MIYRAQRRRLGSAEARRRVMGESMWLLAMLERERAAVLLDDEEGGGHEAQSGTAPHYKPRYWLRPV